VSEVSEGTEGEAREEGELMRLLTIADLQDVLGVGRNTAYELVKRQDFPAFRVGGQWRIREEKLIEWCDARAEDEEHLVAL